MYDINLNKKDIGKVASSYSFTVLPAAENLTPTFSDYIRWFLNGFLWGVPVLIEKMGSVPLSELPSALFEYLSKMQTAEFVTGGIGWISSLATIGIARGLWRRYTRGKE